MTNRGIDWLINFVRESNRIEGIEREPTAEEVLVSAAFISLPSVRIYDLAVLLKCYQPSAFLRDKPGLDVRVGQHIPPSGGPKIARDLASLLVTVNEPGAITPYAAHHAYETLHPFTDGNGRTGRMLWLWHMRQVHGQDWEAPLGFLHQWYYQSLEAGRL